jgi:hypothetical protein
MPLSIWALAGGFAVFFAFLPLPNNRLAAIIIPVVVAAAGDTASEASRNVEAAVFSGQDGPYPIDGDGCLVVSLLGRTPVCGVEQSATATRLA